MMTDEIVNRVMRLVMQGLAEHEDQDLTDRVSLESFTSALRERLNDYVILAKKDAHLSQPQPVAQGEAVGEIRYGEIAGTDPIHDELVAFMADTYMEVSYSPRDAAGAILPYPSRVCAGIEAALGHVYVTPTIPTGHRVVPVDLIASACSAIEKKRDAPVTLAELRRYTFGDLSAAPDAGGV